MQIFHCQNSLHLAVLFFTLSLVSPLIQADEPEIAVSGIEGELSDNVHAFLGLYKEILD